MGNLGMDCHGAHTTDIIISVRLPTSPTWLLFSVPSSDQTSSKQLSCSCLTAPKHLSKIQIQYSNPQPHNHNQQPPHKHNRLSTVCPARPHQCQQPRQSQGSLNTHQRLKPRQANPTFAMAAVSTMSSLEQRPSQLPPCPGPPPNRPLPALPKQS
ncbi:hypothetical protein FJTKL_12041 [Diaporthe vaccinii]|uniref:Uncharacterized protein n=1 Tax=Diaporthe vaccinii TaxID=105482 RepID=A0ABR4FAZ9_9PEZI